jgi:hypothetical protein
MYEQTVDGVLIDPAGFDESGNQRSWLAIPPNPGFDGRIRIFAEVALWCEATREVPDHLEPSGGWSFGLLQNGHKVCEFRMVRCSSQHDFSLFEPKILNTPRRRAMRRRTLLFTSAIPELLQGL